MSSSIHTGFIESQHIPYNIEKHPNHPFPKRYCICGGSGGLIFCQYNKTKFVEDDCIDNEIEKIKTCNYYTGISCNNYKLYRRWSCCKKGTFGTIEEMLKINCGIKPM